MSLAASKTFAVAPMMDWTDRHARYFLRLISARARLYTEMITAEAVLHGDRDRLLGFDAAEHPLAVQLGGAEPARLSAAARIAADYGYDEINLNVGCPSDRVQSGRFGACLMREPALVGDLVAAMAAATPLPVTVKCRIGVDDQDEGADFDRFIDIVAAAGCDTFIVHARKAWLEGLSPKQNRDIPPLNHARVHALKARRPDLTLLINGGLTDLDQVAGHWDGLDGAMVGRAAYQDPWILADVDRRFYGAPPAATDRHQVIDRLLPYLDRQIAAGVPLKSMTRHLLGLFNGLPGARAWRRHLAEHAQAPAAGPEVVAAAAGHVPPLAAAA